MQAKCIVLMQDMLYVNIKFILEGDLHIRF